MLPTVSGCPVPPEQRPVNEYQALRESWPFRWVTFDVGHYSRKLLWVCGWSLLLTAPLAAAEFPPGETPLKFVLTTTIAVSVILGLVLLRLYLGWVYVCDRLASHDIFYEETGWYDGQTWMKPPEVQLQDRLICDYQVRPLLRRIQQSLIILMVVLGTSVLLWQSL